MGKNEQLNSKLKIIPLGGMEQIGMNITVFEYEDSIIVVDCGLAFPDMDMLGVDLVIPDITYLKENIEKALKTKFRPEFLNRMDDIIVFHRLTKDECIKIGRKIVEGLAKRLLEQRGIVLTVTDVALAELVEEGYDAEYGARPLKRVIQRNIEDKLSEEILVGRIQNGQRVMVDSEWGKLRFITR